LLAGRAHFRAELAKKLAARGYEQSEVAAALDRCARQGFLDDLATAKAFVEERRRRGLGRSRLAAELSRRGAGREAIAAALGELSAEDDLAAAREAAARWRRGGSADGARLARHLDRKGFSRRAILAVLEEGGGVETAELLDAEAAPDPAD
jgi:regulatory protein